MGRVALVGDAGRAAVRTKRWSARLARGLVGLQKSPSDAMATRHESVQVHVSGVGLASRHPNGGECREGQGSQGDGK